MGANPNPNASLGLVRRVGGALLALAYSRLRGLMRGRGGRETATENQAEADVAQPEIQPRYSRDTAEVDVAQPLLRAEGGGEESRSSAAPPLAQRPPAKGRALHLLLALYPILLGTARAYAHKSSYPVRPP